MIVSYRSNPVTFSTDTVAHSLRSVIATRAARLEVSPRAEVTAPAPLDLTALYPALHSAAVSAPSVGRSLRAAAFRLSVAGTAAMTMIALLHH